jgi:diguanylate cyclase (GGDEF)-like protein
VVVAGLGLVSLVAVALVSTSLGASAITEQVNARLTGAGRQAAGYLAQVVTGQVTALDQVADQLPILAVAEGSPSADLPTATADLAALAQADAESDGIVLTDSGGVPMLRTGSQEPLSGLPGDWPSRLVHGGSLVVAAPSSLAAPAIEVAVPVLEGGGTAGGFLVERYSLSGALSSVEAVAAAEGMTIRVVDGAGGLVLGAQPTVSGGASPVTTWTPDASLTKEVDATLRGGVLAVDDGGAAGPAAYGPMTQVPWVVEASLPGSSLAAVSGLRITVFSICAALALLFLVTVTLVNRLLRRKDQTEAALIVQSAAMEHAAMHDPLTGLPNRLLFNDRLQHGISNARRSGHPMALFVLDIDGFKALNDDLGHAAGDVVLRETAMRLQASVRVSDTVARLGGDEFAIVAVDADPSEAELITAKVRQRMEEPVMIDERLVPVGLSIGLAAFPDDGGEPAHLLRRADTNMYHEKRARKAAPG